MLKRFNQGFERSMVQMGLRHPIPMRALLSLRWITIATGIGALALSLVVLDGIASLLGLTVGLVLCALVDLVVRVRATWRCARFEAELPDAIDLLTLAMDAGLSLDASLHRIAVDLAGRSKLLGDEFLALSLALHSGLGRAEALADMAWRCQSKSLDMLATLVAQAERLGTSMIDASKALAQSMRQQREFDAEERAGQVAVQLVVPLVLCMLPALFVVLLGPALLQVSDVLKEL
ncbi:MAG: type II secretion system F family protein [Betaproteobacteria bacterium]|nr:type II secretion system F family protein [Betaproteobacteria bacterium]